MIHTGLVRRVDTLGRIVIPMEIRKILQIHVGDALEVSYDENSVVFRNTGEFIKCEPLVHSFVTTLYTSCGIQTAICDRNTIIAAHCTVQNLIGTGISDAFYRLIKRGGEYLETGLDKPVSLVDTPEQIPITYCIPFAGHVSCCGAIAVLNKEKEPLTENEIQRLRFAANTIAEVIKNY